MSAEINQQEESPEEEEHNTSADKKEGRSCFGCLCDMRRAVVILSALGILVAIFSVVINHFLLFEPARDEVLDDSDTKQLDDLFTISMVVAGLSVVGFSLSIIGGVKFNQVLVIVNTMYMPIGFAVNQAFLFSAASEIEGFDYGFSNMIGPLIGIVMSVFVHVSFVKEIRGGIMSEKNYEREKQSCCCV